VVDEIDEDIDLLIGQDSLLAQKMERVSREKQLAKELYTRKLNALIRAGSLGKLRRKQRALFRQAHRTQARKDKRRLRRSSSV
jgi:hypothetical protein